MWLLENNTPFKAERTWISDRDGALQWIVIVKGTYIIGDDGIAALAQRQEDLCRVPVYRGEPGTSSLIYESDLLPPKPAVDVILNGHAYAPAGKPCQQVDVTMKTADLTKTLRVFGERYRKGESSGYTVTDPEPFEKMPIVYERAYGGSDNESENKENIMYDTRNPVGRGFIYESGHLSVQKMPNVEYPDQSFQQPAGFGPISPHWSPRRELAGTFNESWLEERFPLVPSDFDERFYLCAPVDQQIKDCLSGGEQVELHNLTPDGLLRFRLPGVKLRFITTFYGKNDVEHHGTLQTIVLEPDMSRLIMVWGTCISCHHDVLKLNSTIIWTD